MAKTKEALNRIALRDQEQRLAQQQKRERLQERFQGQEQSPFHMAAMAELAGPEEPGERAGSVAKETAATRRRRVETVARPTHLMGA